MNINQNATIFPNNLDHAAAAVAVPVKIAPDHILVHAVSRFETTHSYTF